jgi:TonB family protein
MRDPLFGGVTLTYRPDGRPATAVLEQGELPDRCLDALRALVSVTLDDDRHPATAEVPQLVVLSIGQEWVQCADTPASRRLVNRDELVEQPRKLVDVRPHYPDDARAERIQGVVSFEMVISAEGCVPTITVQRGIHPSISFAALAAVTRWRYTPARLAGEPVDHVLSYVIDFRLR